MNFNFGSRDLHMGSSGDDVKVLQVLLNALPSSITGPDLVVDGDFGSKTQAAVKMFQTYFGLTSDGIVGKNTFLYLGQPTSTGLVFGSRTLKVGISGSDVKILQNRLASAAKKYAKALAGPADSVFGSKTKAAVKLFQTDMGLTSDGIVGDKTFYKLFTKTYMGGRLLQQSRSDGNKGLDVWFLQKKLKDEGFSPGSLDGIFGPKTDAAVKKFQQSVGITVDGEVGPVTYYYLGIHGS
jgi:peptidoglycan hydrolase-like protein with peptidoglycan-binding domain